MTINVDLTGIESWAGGAPPPPGRHMCRIEAAEEGKSSGGYPQVEVSLTVEGGDAAGATMRDWIVINQATLGKVRQFLEAADVEIPEGDFELPTQKLPGRLVAIVVRNEEYDGKTRARVVAYDRADSQSDLPTPDMAGMGVSGGSSNKDPDIPFGPSIY